MEFTYKVYITDSIKAVFDLAFGFVKVPEKYPRFLDIVTGNVKKKPEMSGEEVLEYIVKKGKFRVGG